MKLIIRIFILSAYIIISNLQADPLLMFFDIQKAETEQSPYYVSYQLVTALFQKPSPIFASSSLLRNITNRAQIFSQKIKNQKSLEYALQQVWMNIHKYFDSTDSYVASASNKYNKQWIQQNYAILVDQESDAYKQASFNFLCYHILSELELWNIYNITPHFVVLVPPALQKMPAYKNFAKITYDKVLDSVGTSAEFLQALEKILELSVNYGNSPIHIYLSGHGEYAEGKNKGFIAGLQAADFSILLDQLQKTNKINLLVYNSCYAGGRNTIAPYQTGQMASKKFTFTIVNVSLTDAPTYTFGFPEGMKFPPYDLSKYLLPSDFTPDNKITFNFMQDFTKFFTLTQSKSCTAECIETVNPYLDCDARNNCKVAHVENIPMILAPGATQFVPFDTKYVNQQDGIMLLTQSRYSTMQVMAQQKLLPMIVGNYWYQIDTLQSSEQQTITDFIKQAFLSIPDLLTPYVLYVPTATIGYKVYKNVVLLHNTDIAPAAAGSCKVLLYYEEDGKSSAACFENETWNIVQTSEEQKNNMQAFIKLAVASLDKPLVMQADAIKNYYKVTQLATVFSSQCVQQNICKPVAN